MKSTVNARSGQDSQFSAVMDVNDALERLGNDEDLLRDIIQIYLEDAPGIVERIHAAVKAADPTALQRAAHSLKGLASTLSAHDLVGAAMNLEYIGASRNLAEAAKALEEVDQRVSELEQAAKQLLRTK